MSSSDDESRDAQTLAETARLCRQASRGDREALTALYERHYDRVRRSAALRMGRPLRQCEQDIDDVVQEVFADVFRRLEAGLIRDVATEGAFRNYMATAVLNAIRMRARRARTRKRGEGRELLLGDCADTSLDEMCAASQLPRPSEIARGRELEDRIEAALLELGERHRRVLDLVYHCGMTPTEIAESGAMPEASKPESVRLLLFRARQMLQRAGHDLLDQDSG